MKHPTLLLALTIGCLGLAGCGGWLSRELVPTTTRPTITVQDSHPTGTPIVTIQTTPDGWQITALQPIERTEVEERAITERVQRTLFFPPALFSGLIQCPIGGLTWMISLGTLGHNLATHGCWRLLMVETLPGNATMTNDVAHTTRTILDSEPLRGAIVHLAQAQYGQIWTGILALDGTVLIPYSSVSERTTTKPLLTMTILRQDDTIWSGPLPDKPRTVRARPAHHTWPHMLAFQIEESNEGDTTLIQPLQQLLQHELLKQNQCVVVGDSARILLRNEVLITQSGLTTETEPTSSLNWIPATVLIRTVPDQQAGIVQISLIDVERGQVLDSEILSTSVSVGQQSAQIRMMMKDRLPRQRSCQKIMTKIRADDGK